MVCQDYLLPGHLTKKKQKEKGLELGIGVVRGLTRAKLGGFANSCPQWQ